ncbi:MAG TPA: hypothetical protein DCW46_06910 [Desulfotomaculum sp.]|nr:hypothetical protein [Desulfotomaculum sp.]HAU31976.1 hypothetical protein [Desulfotomaculum sp.]
MIRIFKVFKYSFHIALAVVSGDDLDIGPELSLQVTRIRLPKSSTVHRLHGLTMKLAYPTGLLG